MNHEPVKWGDPITPDITDRLTNYVNTKNAQAALQRIAAFIADTTVRTRVPKDVMKSISHDLKMIKSTLEEME